jgi:hypothetical protein
VKNKKIVIIAFIVLIVSMFCVARFTLISDKDRNNIRADNNIPNPIMGPREEPKLILDADEISKHKINYNTQIPIDSIINNERKYKKYYEDIIQSVEILSAELDHFPFYLEEGYYISKVPIYHFYAQKNTIGNEVQVVLFSKDLEKQVQLVFFFG